MTTPDAPAEQVRRALLALSAMTSAREGRTEPGTIPLDWFRWLPVSGVHLLERLQGIPPFPPGATAFEQLERSAVTIDRGLGERLQAVDRLRLTSRNLRVGWLFVAGTTTDAKGRRTKVFWPLVSRPVKVVRPPLVGPAHLQIAGDTEITARVADHFRRFELDAQIQLGGGAFSESGARVDQRLLDRMRRLREFAFTAAAECGWEARSLVSADQGPEQLMKREGLIVVAGFGVFTTTETGGLSSSATLETWSTTPLDRWTAFHAHYVDVPDPPALAPRPGLAPPMESPFLLTPAQRDAVRDSRSKPITVLRGAPGTGKAHTITAIACDALARGECVLVAARSEATIDALIDLFERAPGPRPVAFGSNEKKDALAAKLAAGLVSARDGELDRATTELHEAVAWRRSVHDAIADALVLEQLREDTDTVDAIRAAWPRLFAPDFDWEAASALAERAKRPTRGWWARRRRRTAERRLCDLAGTTIERRDALLRALDVARLDHAATSARDGLPVGQWDELRRADDRVRELAAIAIELESRSARRLDRQAQGAIAALSTALRSGRAARREQLTRMDDDDLTRALPLWVGTLADVDDLLPPIPALFDVVVLDEASSIDQPSAATTLLRGRRAVVVGDPQQLRHVSFLGDDARDDALTGAGIDLNSPLAAKLDARRNSAFDVAAANEPAITLDEHFRCAPHLVDFVAERLYGGRVRVATRSPATSSVDCVEFVRVEGHRDGNGVVHDEVAAVMAELERAQLERPKSVGIISPFRAQADALERAVLDRLDADAIEALDLRVGTVHAFQGNERDVVIVSLGIGRDAKPGSWRFVEDPHLFTVMATRARRQLIVVHAADPPPGGLLAAWLAQADAPPGPPKPVPVDDEWTNALAQAIADTDTPFVSAYPTGRHLVDVCIGDQDRFLGVECAVHPDGPDAHIDRHLALMRRGWQLVEAFPSRWGDRRAELAVELARMVERPG